MKILKYVLVLLVSFCGLTACGSPADSAARFIESGKELLAENKPEKARIEFKNAIQVDPKVAEPYYQLALLDEKAKSWKSMYTNLLRVEQLNPMYHEATIKLGQLYLLSGNNEFAMERADKVLSIEPENILAWILKSSVELKKENYGLAMEHVEHALKIEPLNIEAISLKAILLNKEAKVQQAIALLTDTINKEPDQLALKMIKLSILEEQKDYSAMESMYQELMGQPDTETWVFVSLAKLYNMQGKYLEAKEVLEKFVKAQPANVEAKQLLVSLVERNDPEQALSILKGYIEEDPTAFDLRFKMVGLLISQGKIDAAKTDLEAISQQADDIESANKASVMLANFDMQQDDREAANKKLDEVFLKNPEHEAALLLKARIEVINGDIDSAVTRLRIVLRNNPESEQALVLLAQAYMNSGSVELAEDSFRQALAVNPGNTVAALSVAKGLMESNDLNRTESVLMEALSKTPNNDPILQTLAQVRLLKKDWQGTQSIVDTLEKSQKNSVVASFLSARISQGQERYSDAIEEYKAVLQERPDMGRAIQGLAYCSVQLGQEEELLSYLGEFTANNPRQFTAYLVQSNIYAKDKAWEQAVAVLDKGLAVEEKWIGGYSAQATLYLQQKQFNKAINTYMEGLKVAPENNALAMQLASLYEQQKEFNKAKELYEQVVERDATIEPAINNLASLLTDQFRSEENLKKAEDISARFENATEPYYLDTYGWVKVQLGLLDEAQHALEVATLSAPNVAVFNYHLGYLYQLQNKPLKAAEYLKKAKELADEQGDAKMSEQVSALLAAE
ncbi:MAG: tetratricopeptide repeat protein [Cycloclasticus sp.]|uniref:tetratricopeptide repeat protein n=1 Tax=Cycloclasticus sp. TaxID=2024830 RepID=UPI00257F559D|nr:tetratricopeptide repeat protein [Cycloclasticus sp.]MBV1899641.1 tetratricopeptide repeat protein [Cycloclasticus sp.]